MLSLDDLLLETGVLRFGSTGSFFEFALMLEAFFLEAVGRLFVAVFLGIDCFETITVQQKREILQGDYLIRGKLVALDLGCWWVAK